MPSLLASMVIHGYGAFWAGTNVSQIRALEAPDLINQLVLEMAVPLRPTSFRLKS